MTINEAISKVDALKVNTYGRKEKIEWLSTLDGTIKKEIIDFHEGDKTEFNGYNQDTPADTKLLVPAPYDDIYLRWLEAQIDYCNDDTTQYANSMAMFNMAYSSFDRYYNRAYMPIGRKMKFF